MAVYVVPQCRSWLYVINFNSITSMKNLPLDPAIFTSNRQRFVQEMKAGSIAIFNSNDEMPSNGDALYPYKQNSDLYWLNWH